MGCPNGDHENFKKFMLNQLQSSLEADDSSEFQDRYMPKRLTHKEWLEEHRSNAEREVEYHTKEYAREVERVKNNNKWLKDLRGSLK